MTLAGVKPQSTNELTNQPTNQQTHQPANQPTIDLQLGTILQKPSSVYNPASIRLNYRVSYIYQTPGMWYQRLRQLRHIFVGIVPFHI